MSWLLMATVVGNRRRQRRTDARIRALEAHYEPWRYAVPEPKPAGIDPLLAGVILVLLAAGLAILVVLLG